MANTFTQIHIHIVFAVKYRNGLIQNAWKEGLYKYISGIIEKNSHKLLAINGMPDHVHICIGMRPTQSLAALIQDIKGDSSKWINQNKLVRGRFEWQSGYGAFSYSKSQVDRVIDYIRNQELHHQKKSFIEEYKDLLNKFHIHYDARYLFQHIE
jgi:putative transposase